MNQENAIINALKIRCFDAEETVKVLSRNNQLIVGKVMDALGIDAKGIESLDDFFAAVEKKTAKQEEKPSKE